MTKPRDTVVLDSDTLSELSRGNATVRHRALCYLEQHGALTITAVTVYERLRGYRAALAAGKPFEEHLRKFQALVATCRVLPLDDRAADSAVRIWVAVPKRIRRATGDILIAAVAASNGLGLVTRNRRDFSPMTKAPGVDLRLLDWTR